MGKNQTHKAMQQSKHSGRAGGEPGGDGGDGHDASFHTAEWHAARLAALQVERPSWEDWRRKQKEEELKEQAVLDEQEQLMVEYKQGLEEDRAKRLGQAAKSDDKKEKKEKKSKKRKRSSKDKKRKHDKHKKDDKHRHSKKKKKRRRHSSSSSSSDSGSSDASTSSSDSGSSRDPLAKESKEKKEDLHGPVKLSDYLFG